MAAAEAGQAPGAAEAGEAAKGEATAEGEAAAEATSEGEAAAEAALPLAVPLGRVPCHGLCFSGGLLNLNPTQRGRLQHACNGGHWSRQELEFVRWGGALPRRVIHQLIGLYGGSRDQKLEELMAAVDAGDLTCDDSGEVF